MINFINDKGFIEFHIFIISYLRIQKQQCRKSFKIYRELETRFRYFSHQGKEKFNPIILIVAKKSHTVLIKSCR